jgi:hypothetical protein
METNKKQVFNLKSFSTMAILSHKFSVFATLNQSLYELAQVSKATEFKGCI